MAIMPEEQNLQMQVTRLLKLENTINEMCLQIPGFFWKNGCDVQLFCRIRKWKNFFVVELNGAASEPTHIYDPHSLFSHGRN
jgi:hypothetical protein